MRRIAICLIAMLPCAAHAEYHTVSWFADHPAETQGVMKLCHDNAGLARHNPNCINANEAATEIMLRRIGAAGSPIDPKYWVGNRYLPIELNNCDGFARAGSSIDSLTARICIAARKAAGQ